MVSKMSKMVEARECGIQDEGNGNNGKNVIVKANAGVWKPDNVSAQPVSKVSEWLSKMRVTGDIN